MAFMMRQTGALQETLRHCAVEVRGAVQVVDPDVLVGRVRLDDGPGTEEQRLPPAIQKGNVCREGKHRRLDSGHGRKAHRRHFEDVLNRHEPADGRFHPRSQGRRRTHGAEHHFSVCVRRDDVRRDAA
jgi:hypothetical protein